MTNESQIKPEAIPIAIAAYNAARAEIVERVKIREDVIKSYIVATTAFAGVSMGFVEKADMFWVSFVMPIISLPVSIIVRQHKEAVETLALFLRNELGGLFTALGVPTWDDYTRATEENEQKKSRWTFVGNLVGIHFLTAFSVAVLGLRFYSRWASGDRHAGWAIVPFVSALAAFCVTATSHGSRKKNLKASLERRKTKSAAASGDDGSAPESG
jgi:predicted permease